MNRLSKLLKELPYDDLVRIKRDIAEGNMLRIVDERIDEFENPNRVCPVCNAPVDPRSALTLMFGPKGLRQRASFDGEDCLAYFVKGMRQPANYLKTEEEREDDAT